MAFESGVLLEGLGFGEAPRWHDGRLWFSDMYAHKVMNIGTGGDVELVTEIPGQPSGLGWLPDGRLLVVSMIDRRLLRLDPEGLVEVADLSALASCHCNDMVVDKQGRAYIGNFGFDLFDYPYSISPAEIILVMPDGGSRIVADDLIFPNGTVITPDGRTLIVAETFASRLTAFDIAADGSLSGRRVWASLENRSAAASGVLPDGICLDAEGAVWVADAGGCDVLRVREGGEVVDRISLSGRTFACMLGGQYRRTLFVMTAVSASPDEAGVKPGGRIEMVRVAVPGAGLP